MIAATQVAFGKAAGAAKPYKARLEYLESTGTQYIDTEYILNIKSKLELVVVWNVITSTTATAQQMGFVKWNDSGNYRTIFAQQSEFMVLFCADANLTTAPYLDRAYTYTADLIEKKGSISTPYTSVSANIKQALSGTFTQPFYIFARNNGGVAEHFCKCNLYSFKAYTNNTLVRDLIPVLDNDDTPCMYDEVSGEFFYNQGTGEFIAGPEITEE